MSSIGGEHESNDSDGHNAVEIESTIGVPQEQHSEASEYALDESDQSDDSDRPGRYRGPDYNWRYLVKEEVASATALAHAENDDLSLHLYNTHAWKIRHRRSHVHTDVRSWHSKDRWIQPGEDNALPFLPPHSWTAWPLKSEDVPRSQERWGHIILDQKEDNDTFSKSEPWRPSLHLQEELLATFLRQAKEGFSLRNRGLSPSDFISTALTSRSHTTSTSDEREASSMEVEDSDEGDDSERLGFGSGRATVQPASLTSEDEYSAVFMDDDDTAGEILQPIIRHILSKTDDLLIALHKSRQRHRTAVSHSGRSSQSVTRSASRSKTESSTPATRRKRIASDAMEADSEPQHGPVVDERGSESGNAPARRSTMRQSRQHHLGLRDWSEVLGMAAMIGWDQTVIDSAARRCATTFGEGMAMRVMADFTPGKTPDCVIEYKPVMIPTTNMPSKARLEQPANQDVSRFPYTFPDCTRNKDSFDKPWRLREHLKRKHKQSTKDIAVAEEESTGRAEADLVSEEENESTPKFPCPHVSCPRHSKPFDERFRLNEHLKRKHKRQQELTSTCEADLDERIQDHKSVDATGSRYSGLSRDSFLQPITLEIGRSSDIRPRSSLVGSSRPGFRKSSEGRDAEIMDSED